MSLLIYGLVLLLSAKISAQPTETKFQNKLKADIHYSIGFSGGISHSNYSLKPYDNWEENFYLPRIEYYGISHPPLYAPIDTIRTFVNGDIFFQIKPTIKMGCFELGIPVNFYLSNIISLPVTKLKVDLRNDFEEDKKLKVNQLRLLKQTPAIGISTRIGKSKGLEVQLLSYKYTLREKRYKEATYKGEARYTTGIGGYFYSTYKYTEYYSKLFKKTDIDNGLAQIISIGFWEGKSSLSFYMEKISDYVNYGITYTVEL
jgi:hypothetical protein